MAQGEKLSFLIKALVKASRLETGIVVPVPSLHSVGVLLEDVAQQEEQAAQEKGIRAGGYSPLTAQRPFDPR